MDLEHSNSHPQIANGSSPALLRDVHDCETVLYILEDNSCNDQLLNFGHCLQGSKGNFVIFILQRISGNSALVSWNHSQCQVDLQFFNETRLSRTWTAWLACHWVVVVGVSQKRSGAARNPRLAGVPCRAEGCCNLLGALFRQSPEADNKK